jgi:hypothetical protein
VLALEVTASSTRLMIVMPRAYEPTTTTAASTVTTETCPRDAQSMSM